MKVEISSYTGVLNTFPNAVEIVEGTREDIETRANEISRTCGAISIKVIDEDTNDYAFDFQND